MFDPKSEVVREDILSPWITLVSKTYDSPQGPQVYHSFKQKDYIVNFAMTREGKIPLVRQYRPAAGAVTLELPAGLGEDGEDPGITAQRELFEETGLSSDRKPNYLGKYLADTGRLSNFIHFYFTDHAFQSPTKLWTPEAGIEVVLMTKREFREAVLSGGLTHSMHLAAISLSQIHKLFEWDS